MSKNGRRGTLKPHGKTVGYIVSGRGGVGSLCYGWDGPRDEFRYGNPVTLFQTRRKAQRAIDGSVANGIFGAGELSILRVAAPK